MPEIDARMPQDQRTGKNEGVGQSGDLFAVLTRWEIPAGRWSWRDGSAIIKVTVGAHCVDLAWPWWTPWQPWKS